MASSNRFRLTTEAFWLESCQVVTTSDRDTEGGVRLQFD